MRLVISGESLWNVRSFTVCMERDHRIHSGTVNDSRNLNVVHQSSWKDWGCSPVTAIIMAVAEDKGLHFTEIPPLADHIDPEALSSLFKKSEGTSLDTVRFDALDTK